MISRSLGLHPEDGILRSATCGAIFVLASYSSYGLSSEDDRANTKEISRASGDDGQFGGRFSIPAMRGERLQLAQPAPHLAGTPRNRPRPSRAWSRELMLRTVASLPIGLQYLKPAHRIAHATKRGTSYPCTSSHAARKDRRARCRS